MNLSKIAEAFNKQPKILKNAEIGVGVAAGAAAVLPFVAVLSPLTIAGGAIAGAAYTLKKHLK